MGAAPLKGAAAGVVAVWLAGSDSPGTLAVYLGLLGFGFRVVSPPELADRIRDLVARYQRSVTVPGRPGAAHR
jgi:hypothetical protein